MDELNKTESTDEQEILNQLTKLEEKLNKLKRFSEKSEELRSTRKKMVENLATSSKRDFSTESKTDTKRVQFSQDSEDKERELRKRTTFVAKAQKSASLHNLLTGLSTWQEEVKSKKSEIEMLKTKRLSMMIGSDETAWYEEKIKNLELENDELSDDILHFILQNMNEGKEGYQDLIQQLEDENKAMEDTIYTLSKQVTFLKENNRALLWENDELRQNRSVLRNSLSTEDMARTYRKSMFCRKSSALLPEANMFFASQDLKSPSVQMVLDLEMEEKLSLDKESTDSFTLDNQIMNWKLDEDSMQNNLNRLEQEHHEMEVIEMNLNLVKRYVRKHGVKQLNKDTFVEPNSFKMKG